jgi:hypothetical protein
MKAGVHTLGNDGASAHEQPHVREVGVVLAGVEHGQRVEPSLPLEHVGRPLLPRTGVVEHPEVGARGVDAQQRDVGGAAPAVGLAAHQREVDAGRERLPVRRRDAAQEHPDPDSQRQQRGDAPHRNVAAGHELGSV